ncbi:MAG: tRNA glutamyl-Q(34) synthetase GluQRS [Burkholderiales bacterium]|nr:tRNA glutamyl-Q(34) synthetase GluQRS [Burkholderiales bacterium]
MPLASAVSTRYRGRFAPSPTGPLHFGSLVAAVGSRADARAHGGDWLVRIEDLDVARESPGAADAILRALEALGMGWDGAVIYQSRRADAYRAALARLTSAGLTYPCGCSRKEIADSAVCFGDTVAARADSPREQIYPGTCRNGLPPGRAPRAIRCRVDNRPIDFEDAVQGAVRQCLAREVGDFVLLRADGVYAYQLAVVVDDAEQGLTDVVRGADLLDSTPRQIHLQRALGYPVPRYCHLPVATDARGDKLSKQTRAAPIDPGRPFEALARALAFLGHAPPADLGDVEALWAWATDRWDRARIPRARAASVA